MNYLFQVFDTAKNSLIMAVDIISAHFSQPFLALLLILSVVLIAWVLLRN